MPDKLLHKHITDKILRAFYNVYNTLGLGFLEKVYENELAIEVRSMGAVWRNNSNLRFIITAREWATTGPTW
jgi:GxxExxY protein